MNARVITVAAIGIREGRCRECRRRILWATTQSQPGRRARSLPFDPPRPWPLRTERNDETGISFEVWPTHALHRVTCPAQHTHERSRGTR